MNKAEAAEKMKSGIDPVCGMVVVKGDERHKVELEGKLYKFCSKTCKEEFVKNPDEYSR